MKVIDRFNVFFFDLDGVLVNTEPLYFRFWKEACAFYGYKMSDQQALDMRSLDTLLGEELFESFSPDLDYFQVREKRKELMSNYIQSHPIMLKDGAIEVLSYLKERGNKIYIVTANKIDKALKTLKDVGLDKYVDDIISAKDAKRGKPFPYVYLDACQKVGVNPNEVIVFEDSPNGVKSSHAAGCYTVMVEDMTPYTPDMDYVDEHVKSLTELMR